MPGYVCSRLLRNLSTASGSISALAIFILAPAITLPRLIGSLSTVLGIVGFSCTSTCRSSSFFNSAIFSLRAVSASCLSFDSLILSSMSCPPLIAPSSVCVLENL